MHIIGYRGMSYSQASQEGARLIAAAAVTGRWATDLPERLIELRRVLKLMAPLADIDA